jgi:hypothetical protein
MVVQTCYSKTPEAEAGRLQVWGLPGQYSKLQASYTYLERPWFKKKKDDKLIEIVEIEGRE